jgi:preprotein translocase subunit SecA
MPKDDPLAVVRDAVPDARARIAELRIRPDSARPARGRPDALDAVAWAADATRRVLGVDLHDVQLMAGLAMCQGWTVQMLTGEGKTFAAIAPALFHGLAGDGVHVVTANPYLAERDAAWSGAVLRALGLTVGATLPGMERAGTRAAYACDVTFGADREFGFDYLRDNLWLPGEPPVQRGRAVAIVDEADAVLLDQARTPLVLSGAAPADAGNIGRADAVVAQLVVGEDVTIDGDAHVCELTDAGIARCEQLLGVPNLYADADVDWSHRIGMALRARAVLQRDRDYVVGDGVVSVVDELTGRIAEGRRWSDGLQQAVEAKEGVAIADERRPLARITVGSYFAGYEHLVGMSGTLAGAEEELADTFAMRVVAIPPDRPVIRRDEPDREFADTDARAAALVDDVERRHASGQPVLVGTVSIAQSNAFSRVLETRGVPHRVLSARNDAEEAEIIAQAGRSGAVTVATQMAGRGVDIVLDEPARAAGGLMIWGLEHHSSGRLDMQLRGRSGRQGDPGETRFALCPTDEIAAVGQAKAEELDAELRATVQSFDSVVDEIQEKMHSWRRRCAEEPIAGELHAALDKVAAAIAVASKPQRMLRIADIAGLEATGKRRLRTATREADVRTRIGDVMMRRSDELGGPAPFALIAQVTLAHLLVVMWADELDMLEAEKRFARIPLGYRGDNEVWRQAANKTYQTFVATVRHEWVAQLAALRLGRVDVERATAPTLPAAPSVAAEPIDAPEPPAAWKGFSFNRWVRNVFGHLLNWEPPVVLALDAVGDTSISPRARVRLDLDDPANSVVELITRPG